MLHLIFLIVEIKIFGNVNHHFVKYLNAAIVSLSFRGWHVYTLRINYLSQITINVDKNFTHNYWFQKNHYDYNNLFLFWCVLCDLYTDICCIQCIGQSVDPLPKNLFLENRLYNYVDTQYQCIGYNYPFPTGICISPHTTDKCPDLVPLFTMFTHWHGQSSVKSLTCRHGKHSIKK